MQAFAASERLSPSVSYPFGRKLEVEYLPFADAREELDARLRITYTTKHLGYAFEYANSIYFLCRPGERPLPFIGREAMVISRVMRMERDVYQSQINEFSFPLSLATGEYIREVPHPVTGRPLEIPAFKTSDTAGSGWMYSPEGDWPLSRPALTAEQIAQRPKPAEAGQTVPEEVLSQPQPGGRSVMQQRALNRLRRENDVLVYDQVKVPPDARWFPKDFVEHFTHQCRVSDFNDRSIDCIPAVAAGSWILPLSPFWLPGMDDVEGFIMVHVEKRKLADVNDYPDRFLAKVRRVAPYILEIDESRFRTGPSVFDDE